MKYSFNGIGAVTATFGTATGADLEPGTPVKMSSGGTVAACSSGDDFIGAVLGCRGGCACVQIAGCIELACSGTAPAPGYVKLAADANGGVCSGEGRERLVLDCSDGIVTIML